MKKMNFKKYLVLAVAAVTFGLTSCSKDDNSGSGTGTTDPNVVEVKGDITTNTTWSADKIYHLNGFVYVMDGVTLTIEPGTLIKGDKVTKSTLVVTRGGKINATGTVDKPIVFTSNQAAGSRNAGDWGGLILLGKAPVNAGTDVKIEGGLVPTNGGDEKKYISYGGTVSDDNSGTLKYVRVEYAGVAYTVDNEINGITFGGVGSGTTIDYVEVYKSGDDAFEWFGGTVNAKHLLAIGTQDDDFDTDFGFSGKIQFALAQRFERLADVSGSNGFESDNNADGTSATPQTSAVFSNVTILGPSFPKSGSVNANYANAAQIRRNSAQSIVNSIFSSYTNGIYFDDAKPGTPGIGTSANVSRGDAIFTNNIIYGMKANPLRGGASILDMINKANLFDASLHADALLTDPFKFPASDSKEAGTANFTLKSGSLAATGADFTNAKVSIAFFDKVAYRGAFGTDNWASGWAHLDPNTLPYDAPGKVK